ncbi:MAG TPA: uroporphyrinogen-III C-methyltransferase [Gaiellaceae bacterium]
MTVFLVGAGPGDPGLITARGLELIRSCDVLVHDRLVSDELVAEAPADAIRIGREHLGQDEVDRLLVSYSERALDVVRLKGGDPFVFGRGGEEALALAAAGVPFEVVPGVSSLSAVPAAAGIPVTHRGVSSQVTIANGQGPLDFAALARAGGTLVLFMGLARLREIAEGLLGHGVDPETPAAVISSGTTPEQEAVTGALATIAEEAASLSAPALIVVGDVVALSARLAVVRGTLALA